VKYGAHWGAAQRRDDGGVCVASTAEPSAILQVVACTARSADAAPASPNLPPLFSLADSAPNSPVRSAGRTTAAALKRARTCRLTWTRRRRRRRRRRPGGAAPSPRPRSRSRACRRPRWPGRAWRRRRAATARCCARARGQRLKLTLHLVSVGRWRRCVSGERCGARPRGHCSEAPTRAVDVAFERTTNRRRSCVNGKRCNY
jgi:hypothetical protein